MSKFEKAVQERYVQPPQVLTLNLLELLWD
jgi:hypothetical protein